MPETIGGKMSKGTIILLIAFLLLGVGVIQYNADFDETIGVTSPTSPAVLVVDVYAKLDGSGPTMSADTVYIALGKDGDAFMRCLWFHTPNNEKKLALDLMAHDSLGNLVVIVGSER